MKGLIHHSLTVNEKTHLEIRKEVKEQIDIIMVQAHNEDGDTVLGMALELELELERMISYLN